MAVKYAIASGNWSAGATWNDGTLPVDGDKIYCNGFNVTIDADINLPNAILSNRGSEESLTDNGYFLLTANHTITCREVNVYSSYLFYLQGGNRTLNLNANVYGCSVYAYTNSNAVFTSNSSAIININGNIDNEQGYVVQWSQTNSWQTITVVGNVVLRHMWKTGYIASGSDIINGNLTSYGTEQFIGGNYYGSPSISVTGNFTTDNSFSTDQGIDVGLNFRYLSTFKVQMNSTRFVLTNPNGKIEYAGPTPDPNWYVVLSQQQMTNQNNYPAENNVKQGVTYAYGQKVGTYTPDFPQEANVMQGVTYDNGNKTGTLAPVVLGDYPDVDKVLVGTIFDYGNKVGTLEPTADYPAEADVKQGVVYDYGQKEGTLSVSADYPPESVVMQGVEYAFGEMVGTMDVSVQVGCVTKEDVREGVALLGMGETGTLVVPSADDVREGVVFDNGTIGTLIVQGGGDRLRIADFGYYTNAQSDTYIVDITEADKPKFASAEERILIEMFPTLDLDNIPEMYFDDLFVKYLKYRLIVEYYRTSGINSTFTPSEPTTEIVNYRNVTCEVWLNSANTYLNAWNKKFGLNKPPQKVRL